MCSINNAYVAAGACLCVGHIPPYRLSIPISLRIAFETDDISPNIYICSHQRFNGHTELYIVYNSSAVPAVVRQPAPNGPPLSFMVTKENKHAILCNYNQLAGLCV